MGKSEGKIEKISKMYLHNPIIRFLAQVLPGIGPAADEALVTAIDNIREKRLRAFFDELTVGGIELDEKLAESEDFLHAYFATTRAVLNTRRREKIRLFASLFLTYTRNLNTGKTDEGTTDKYEEMLSILDDLSYLEFQTLLILHRLGTATPRQERQGISEWLKSFWDDFLKTVEADVGIPSSEIPGMLTRLSRTGLCKTYVTSGGVVFGPHTLSADMGYVTPNFETFLRALSIAKGGVTGTSRASSDC